MSSKSTKKALGEPPRDIQVNVRLNANEMKMLRDLTLILGTTDSGVIRALIVKTHGSIGQPHLRALREHLAITEAVRKKILGDDQ